MAFLLSFNTNINYNRNGVRNLAFRHKLQISNTISGYLPSRAAIYAGKAAPRTVGEAGCVQMALVRRAVTEVQATHWVLYCKLNTYLGEQFN